MEISEKNKERITFKKKMAALTNEERERYDAFLETAPDDMTYGEAFKIVFESNQA